MDLMHRNVGEVIDKIDSIEMRDQRPSQGITESLYRAARKRAAIARMLRIGLGVVPILLTKAAYGEYVKATVQAIGITAMKSDSAPFLRTCVASMSGEWSANAHAVETSLPGSRPMC